jgi:uncharacterized sulfatase
LEFTSDGYGGYVFDENMNRVDFSGYRVDCITDFAFEFLDSRDSDKPFFMTVSHIEPHHQNDSNHYQGPLGSKEIYKDFILPGDLAALKGDSLEEYPDYLGACASVDHNLGRLVDGLKEKGLYDNTIIFFASDHGSHFKTRNQDEHLNGYDDYKRTCHDAAIRVPLVVGGGYPTMGRGTIVHELVSTASLPKTMLACAGMDVGDDMIGEDLLDVAQGETNNRANEVFVQISESRIGRAIRTPEYTYAVCAQGKNGGLYMDSDAYVDDFLYDLTKDPHQLHNLIYEAKYTEQKLLLRKRLLHWIEAAEHRSPMILP